MSAEIYEDAPRPSVTVDNSSAITKRAGGCAVGFFVFSLALAASDYIKPVVPPLIIQLTAIALGFGLIHLYGAVARRRWQVAAPDVIQLLATDLRSIHRFYLLRPDYRLLLPPPWPWRERLLHEALYAGKWLGNLLVFAGLGTLLYGIMAQLGIVQASKP